MLYCMFVPYKGSYAQSCGIFLADKFLGKKEDALSQWNNFLHILPISQYSKDMQVVRSS